MAKAIENDSEKRTEIWHKGEQAESRDERIPARLQVERLTTAIDGHFDEHREVAAGTLLAELPPQAPETMREENLKSRPTRLHRLRPDSGMRKTPKQEAA